MTFFLSLFALALGYLATWFVWGVPLPALLALWLGGAALWTLAPRSGQGEQAQGGWTFSRSFFTVALLGLVLWLVGAGVTGLALVLSPDNPLPYSFWGLLPALLLGGAVVAAALAMVSQMVGRARREKGRAVLTPWLWLAGGVAFALLPAVRVDCRGLDNDSFRRLSSGFQGSPSYWGRHPELIPGRAELSADLQIHDVYTALARCSRDAQGHPRVFSWRASEPLLVVYLQRAKQPSYGYSAAAFTLGSHRKLTRWAAAPSPYGQAKDEIPYLNPFWRVGLVLPDVPPELRLQSQEEKGP